MIRLGGLSGLVRLQLPAPDLDRGCVRGGQHEPGLAPPFSGPQRRHGADGHDAHADIDRSPSGPRVSASRDEGGQVGLPWTFSGATRAPLLTCPR
jgi:hypothetical protein